MTSPPYACQFVLVMNEMAVLIAVSQWTERVPLRIEGQAPLSELKEEEGHEAYAAEPEEVAGIGFPRHLFLFIYSAEPGI